MDIVTLLEVLVNGLIEAEEKFLSEPKDFYSLETSVKSQTEAFAAQFLATVLTSTDEQIYNSPWRKDRYIAQRKDRRTLISSVGDITFDCTYYKKKSSGYTYLLEDLIGVDSYERFTEAAEVVLLTEAGKTSYAEAARVLPSKQKITKTTVMNKVHQISEMIPYEAPSTKKECDYLFIEADEDHIAEQHGRYVPPEGNKGFISRLIYIYEYKKIIPYKHPKKELVNTFYFSGVYQGSDGVRRLWEEVSSFVESTYDTDQLKQIFLTGDGANWIKSGTRYLYKSLFCLDKYHLMQYINAAAGQMLDEKEIAKSELWHLLNKRSSRGFRAYTDLMLRSAENPTPIVALQNYVLSNWSAAKRTMGNKIITGCSAEGHVSHVLSDRLSSRPMGWSQTGADRMSKLRCFERNYGREKIIDLVRYSRESRRLKKTGTDATVEIPKLKLHQIIAEHYDQASSYIERIQATMPGITARKIASIRMMFTLRYPLLHHRRTVRCCRPGHR